MNIIAGYEITDEEYLALDHVLQGNENPEQWIERVAGLDNGARAIVNKINKCVAQYRATPRELRTTRSEREAQQQAEKVVEDERMAVEKARREEVMARILKVINDDGITLMASDVRNAIAALAEIAGLL